MFALIRRDLTDTGGRLSQVTIVPPENLHPNKPYWVPVVEEVTDTSTGPDKVVSGWVETVEVARILRARTIRDKTSGEMDTEDQAQFDNALNISGPDRAMLRLIFEVGKAGKTGNWAFFDSVVDAATFKELVWKLIR